MKSILFLCSGNYYRSRFAEEYFNHLSTKFGAFWQAESKGLYQDLSFLQNIGSISIFTLQEMEKRGLTCQNRDRFPVSVTYDDFSRYDLRVAMDKDEHYPLVERYFPHLEVDIEYWDIKDIDFEDPVTACARAAENIERLMEKLLQPTRV
jgi:protein-tyrosine phosphatase